MQDMIRASRMVLSKYATFQGRASRPEFWWWILAVFLLTAATQLIDGLMMAPMLDVEASVQDAVQPLSALVSLLVLLPGLAVAVRRLHDMGRSGWWLFLYLIPVIGFLVLLWFYTRPNDGPNQWGPPTPFPRGST